MQPTPSSNHNMQRQILIAILLLLQPLLASAFQISPSSIREPEGTTIQLTITYESGDWQVPDQVFMDRCVDAGRPEANWVAVFALVGVSGSADFGTGPTDGDLHLTAFGTPQATSRNWFQCNESEANPGQIITNFASIVLNEDELTESDETAEIQIHALDLAGNGELADSTGITVEDVSSGPFSDWVVSVTDVSPTELLADELISITAVGDRITNPDFIYTGGWAVSFLLSTDAQISIDDHVLDSRSFPDFSFGFNETWTGNLGVAPGTYWVGACSTVPDDDPSNDCSDATLVTVIEPEPGCSSQTLSCGQSIAGTLGSSECMEGPQGPGYYAEKFTYDGEQGDSLFLDANWDGFLDGYLFLEGPGGLVIAENDNHTSSSNSHIEFQLNQSGIHTIWASSFQPAVSGNFDLSLDCNGPPGPDLTLDMPSLGEGNLIPGQSMTVSSRLRNTGDRSSDATTLNYVLSSDSIISLADARLGSDGAPGLSAGSSFNQQLILNAPSSSGDYFIGVCADPVPGESSVANNCSAGRMIRVNAKPSCTVQTMACGDFLFEMSLSAADCTGSPRGDGFLTEVFDVQASSGTSLVIDADWAGLDGYLILQAPSGAVVAENDDWKPPPLEIVTRNSNAEQSSPADASKMDHSSQSSHSRIEHAATESGIYRVWTTSYRTGETGAFNVALGCGSSSDPDLVASEVSLDNEQVTTSDQIALRSVVTNSGNSTADSTTVRYLLSRDEEISLDDEQVAASSLPSLSAGMNTQVSTVIDAPDEPGNYWVGICVDQVSSETLIENNCSQINQAATQSSAESNSGNQLAGKSRIEAFGPKGTLIRVSSGNACSTTALSCGQSRSGTLAQEDCDQSPRGTGFFSDRFTFNGTAGDVVSLNSTWTGVDGYLYLEGPNGAVAGENDDFQDKAHSRFEHVLETTGSYRIWSTAFAQGQSGSYELSLNCDAPSAPDLTADKPQLSTTTLRPGQSLLITTQARNQGSGPAQATSVEYSLSSSSTLSANDRVLGLSDVSGLTGGASSAESLTVPLDVTPGQYWVGTCVNSDVMELDTDNNCQVSGPITVEENNQPIPITTGLNDAWFNPLTNGQGFFINIFPDSSTMFLSWFTFDLTRPDAGVPFQLGDPGHRWLTAQGSYDRGVAKLTIFLTQGGRFDKPTPAPVTDRENPYGTMTVSFDHCDKGEIVFEIPSLNQSGTIPIKRVSDDNVGVCEDQIGALASHSSVTLKTSQSVVQAGGETTLSWQAQPDLDCRAVAGTADWRLEDIDQAAGSVRIALESEGEYEFTLECDDGIQLTEASVVVNAIEAAGGTPFSYSQGLNDAWFNPATAGQGFFFNVYPQINLVFMSWFTYETERPPGDVTAQLGEPGHRWLTAQGPFDGDTGNLTLHITRGGVFNSNNPPSDKAVADGTITAQFDDCNTGLVTYNVASLALQDTVPIQRIVRDSIPACEQKDNDEDENNLAVSPSKGDVLENLCGAEVNWHFDWPDTPRASGYDFRLFRNDALEFASTLFKPIKDSEFDYAKVEAVPDEHRQDWRWQYKPRYAGKFGKKALWSEAQTFDVKPTADPCL